MSVSLKGTDSIIHIRWIPRYTGLERFLHWVHTGAFIPLVLTGFVLFNPWLQCQTGCVAVRNVRILHRIAAIRRPVAMAGLFASLLALAGISSAEYADVVLNKRSDDEGVRPVIFSHWFHRIRYQCRVCHGELGFEMKAGANDVTMQEITDGEFCGACHDPEDDEDPVRFLRSETADDVAKQRGIWANAADQLRNRTMPPGDELQPSEAQRLEIIQWIESYLEATACSQGNFAGSPVPRRLNREQYTFAIEDLTGEDRGAHRDALLMGTSLVFEVTGAAADPKEGVARAAEAIDSGKAGDFLVRFREYFAS